jgi:hypothetical protein
MKIPLIFSTVPHMITFKKLVIQCNVLLGLKAFSRHSQVVAYTTVNQIWLLTNV